ncbi:hypothetical protein [Deinococcus multiflagellatus]|uniref:Uncharacterized protein n=1 Tax=Deinococcus multiflagellatus TaxID=1656887 RepID=A0ABW1ZQH0_9DEIO
MKSALNLMLVTGLLSLSFPAFAASEPLPTVTTQQAGETRVILGTTGQTPRLTSVGDGLLWLSGDQVLTLDVASRGLVSVLLTSPALDPQDYRLAEEYGDEQYDRAGTRTVYTLTSPDGRTVAQRAYLPQSGSARDLLFTGVLPAGRYTLRVATTGASKNTFALGVVGARVSAPQVNVTVLSREWVPLATLQPSADSSTLSIYDTDGENELNLRLRFPDGRLQALSGGRDREVLTVTVPAATAGAILLEARIPVGAAQHSNTVGLKVQNQDMTLTPPAPESPPGEVHVTPSAKTPAVPLSTPPVQVRPPEPTPAAVLLTPPVVSPPAASPRAPLILPFTRGSTVSLRLDVPSGGTLLVAHTLPQGATLVPGSATDDLGRAVDLRVGRSGRLYFTVPATVRLVSYRITHSAALSELAAPAIVRLTEQGRDHLQGQIDEDDARTAQRPKVISLSRAEGLLRFPLDGAVLQERSTAVEVHYTGSEPPLLVNGQVISPELIGKRVQGEGFGALTYVAVPLQTGTNILEVGGETVTVRVPGKAAQVVFTPVSLQGDARTPAVIGVEVQDDAGLPVRVPNLTLSIEGAQPLNPDAIPAAPGYQLALTDGRAELRLKPQASGQVILTAGSYAGRATFTLGAGQGQLIVGQASYTLGGDNLMSGAVFRGQLAGRATLELPWAGGQLRLNADSEGLQVLNDVQTPRHLVTGDASTVQNDLTARGAVAAEYRREGVSVRYALKAAVNPLTTAVYDADGLAAAADLGGPKRSSTEPR